MHSGKKATVGWSEKKEDGILLNGGIWIQVSNTTTYCSREKLLGRADIDCVDTLHVLYILSPQKVSSKQTSETSTLQCWVAHTETCCRSGAL